MPQYNEMFELSVEDMELIETALQRTKDALSQEQLELSGADASRRAESVRKIHNLLGRLHNQKIFYYPKDRVYVGG